MAMLDQPFSPGAGTPWPAAEAAAAGPVRDRAFLYVVWAALSAAYAVAGFAALPEGLSTDDAMRLVEVRDFLSGQSWFDLTQHRLFPPQGVVMHWSRLIDLPLAALLHAAKTIAAPPLAERLVLAVWPMIVLLPLLAGVRAVAERLGGVAAGALAVVSAAMLVPALAHFRPGAIDHHNVQLALLIWTLALVLGGTARAAACGGALAAISLAIGLEMLPILAAIGLIVALRWAVQGDTARAVAGAFGASFAAMMLAMLALAQPPSRWLMVTTDALSIAHVSLAMLGGGGLAALALSLRHATHARRFAGLAILVAIGLAILVFVFPQCLRSPYADVDPRVIAHWMAFVSEAQSLPAFVARDPLMALSMHLLPFLALAVVAITLAARGAWRWDWTLCGAALAVACAMTFWQIRATPGAQVIAVAILAAAATTRWPLTPGHRAIFATRVPAILACLAISPAFVQGVGTVAAQALSPMLPAAMSGAPAESKSAAANCASAADYAGLAALPAGLVLAFIDSGPYVLLNSSHAVLAAPYHRNNAGNIALIETMFAADAQQRMRTLGVEYVAFCANAPDRYNYAAAAPMGLAAQLGRGDVASYLTPLSPPDARLRLFKVTKAAP